MNEELIPLFMPSLASLLGSKESEKGSPLTEEEVMEIHDSAHVVMSPVDVYKKVSESRGYDDIDPEIAWEEWKRVRITLLKTSAQQLDTSETMT